MKNIAKILFVAISSFSLMLSANAGELSVSGSAKATYNATSGQQTDNGLGISILSTPNGVLSDNEARVANVGGEVLCQVF